ncbi:unnamed protein product [Amoebophrya sp. A120]|nr:unnamed protein product [Amoebophrya sp. A120]|eukprot:GSA120T00026136001.1
MKAGQKILSVPVDKEAAQEVYKGLVQRAISTGHIFGEEESQHARLGSVLLGKKDRADLEKAIIDFLPDEWFLKVTCFSGVVHDQPELRDDKDKGVHLSKTLAAPPQDEEMLRLSSAVAGVNMHDAISHRFLASNILSIEEAAERIVLLSPSRGDRVILNRDQTIMQDASAPVTNPVFFTTCGNVGHDPHGQGHGNNKAGNNTIKLECKPLEWKPPMAPGAVERPRGWIVYLNPAVFFSKKKFLPSLQQAQRALDDAVAFLHSEVETKWIEMARVFRDSGIEMQLQEEEIINGGIVSASASPGSCFQGLSPADRFKVLSAIADNCNPFLRLDGGQSAKSPPAPESGGKDKNIPTAALHLPSASVPGGKAVSLILDASVYFPGAEGAKLFHWRENLFQRLFAFLNEPLKSLSINVPSGVPLVQELRFSFGELLLFVNSCRRGRASENAEFRWEGSEKDKELLAAASMQLPDAERRRLEALGALPQQASARSDALEEAAARPQQASTTRSVGDYSPVSNSTEARMEAFWQETIQPLLEKYIDRVQRMPSFPNQATYFPKMLAGTVLIW